MLRILRSLGLCRRFGSAFLGIWFIAVTMNLVSAHDCPMHDVVPVSVSASASPGGAMEGHATHHVHGHQAVTQAAPAAPTQHDSGHGCNCISHCCTTAASMQVGEPSMVLTTLVTEVVAPPGRSQQEFMAAWVAFILPFSTAPPTGASA